MIWLKIWAYVKKYWQLCTVIVGAVIGLLLMRRQDSSFNDQLKVIQDAHSEEIKNIQNARVEEQRQSAENEKKLKSTLAEIQTQYDAAEKTLDNDKKKEIEQIVKQCSDNPDELAKRLSASTGFVIIPPNN